MIRNLLFNIFLAIWQISYTFITLPVILFPSRIISAVLTLTTKVILNMLYILCGIKYEVRGAENIPREQAFIVASKHQSPFETFIFILLFRNAVFILKRELIFMPFVGIHLAALKMIFIDRSNGISSLRKMMKLAKMRIKEGRSIIIFPEGTRMSVGDTNLMYNTGIAALYSHLSVPVLPIALNTGLFWPKGIFSLKRNRGTAVIDILPPIYPGLRKNEFIDNLKQNIEEKTNYLVMQNK